MGRKLAFPEHNPGVTERLFDELPVVGEVPIVEDQHDDTTILEDIPPERFLDRGVTLLKTAYETILTLPFNDWT